MNSEVRISWRWPVKKHRGRMVEGLYSDKGMQICTLQVTGDCWRILSWRVIWWTMHLKPFRHDCERWNKRDWKQGDQLDHCWFQGHWCVFFFFLNHPSYSVVYREAWLISHSPDEGTKIYKAKVAFQAPTGDYSHHGYQTLRKLA